MTATSLFFNFPEVSLSLVGIDSSKEIRFTKSEQPVTNIQLNNTNYTAYSIFIASTSISSKTPGHLIVKCLEDIKRTESNAVYIAFPFKKNESENESDKNVIDHIIKSGEETVKLTLNNFIKKGGECFIPNINAFPVMITLGMDSAIPIQQYSQEFYPIGLLGLSPESDVSRKKNASLQMQELDWIMSCDLLNEDGEVKKDQIDPGTTATTISLFMMAILIACASYIGGPILYSTLGMKKLAETNTHLNHYSINVFWCINLTLIAVMCIIKGGASKDIIFYFVAIALLLSFFAGTTGVLKDADISSDSGSGFKETDKMFAVFFEIFRLECSTKTGFAMKIFVFILLIYAFSVLCASMNNAMLFTSHLIMYLVVVVLMLSAISYFNAVTNPV